MAEDHLVIVFNSTSLAIRAEQVARKAGYTVRCIPTPRHISSDCGLVLRILPGEKEEILHEFGLKKIVHLKIAPLGDESVI